MFEKISTSRSLLRIELKTRINEVFYLRTDSRFEENRLLFQHLVALVEVLVLERRFHVEHFVDQYSEGPNVDFFGLKLSLINFRSHVFIGSTKSILNLSVSHAGTEVCEFGPEILGNQNIFRLDVSVDEFLGMQVLDGLNDFVVKFDEFSFVEFRHFFDERKQVSVFGELNQHDQVVVFHVKVQKIDDVLVVETLVNFDFSELPFFIFQLNDLDDEELFGLLFSHYVNFVDPVAVTFLYDLIIFEVDSHTIKIGHSTYESFFKSEISNLKTSLNSS